MRYEAQPARLFFFIPVAFVMVVAASPIVAAPGDCTTAKVDSPLVLPDGTSYPSGTLTLCATRKFSPVTSLHKTSIDRQAIGLLMSRSEIAESTGTTDPFMMFYRQADGSLLLYGYAVPEAGNKTRTYRLIDPRRSRTTSVADLAGASMVTLAARVF